MKPFKLPILLFFKLLNLNKLIRKLKFPPYTAFKDFISQNYQIFIIVGNEIKIKLPSLMKRQIDIVMLIKKKCSLFCSKCVSMSN